MLDVSDAPCLSAGVSSLMRASTLTKLMLGLAFAFGVPIAPAEVWFPYAFTTNAAAITNGRAVVDALLVGDSQSKSNVHTLIGSTVIFAGWQVDGWSPTNVPLSLGSNIVVRVEVPAPGEFRPGCNAWSAMVEGTLKSVDFQNRVIYVRSRPRGVNLLWGR
jgi:hypothetical protein